MAQAPEEERRHHERYDTDLKIAFSVTFDLETKIKFKVKRDGKDSKHSYPATGHNINVEGLGFSSEVKLEKGDMLVMDVFLPAAKMPINMEGRVRWCSPVNPQSGKTAIYKTGVKILKVRGEDVDTSVSMDPINKIQWSIVLESVFGGFKESILKRKTGR